jgi:uncharacterized protein (UPF0548 family)
MMVITGRYRDVLDEQLLRARQGAVTYHQVGATRDRTLPSGYRHDRLSIAIGHGETAWGRACDAITHWKAHAHAGIAITPLDAPIEQGVTVVASRRVGPFMILAPCRIVYATDEPSRFGFAYGTLSGHPEQGEEAFHVVVNNDGSVSAEIVAFSRPADLSTRLAGPIAREIQKVFVRRYLDGIKNYAVGSAL